MKVLRCCGEEVTNESSKVADIDDVAGEEMREVAEELRAGEGCKGIEGVEELNGGDRSEREVGEEGFERTSELAVDFRLRNEKKFLALNFADLRLSSSCTDSLIA